MNLACEPRFLPLRDIPPKAMERVPWEANSRLDALNPLKAPLAPKRPRLGMQSDPKRTSCDTPGYSGGTPRGCHLRRLSVAA